MQFFNATRDTGVQCPALWLARNLHLAGNTVYLYDFGYPQSAVGWTEDGYTANNVTVWPFAGHGEEVGYVWENPGGECPAANVSNLTWCHCWTNASLCPASNITTGIVNMSVSHIQEQQQQQHRPHP